MTGGAIGISGSRLWILVIHNTSGSPYNKKLRNPGLEISPAVIMGKMIGSPGLAFNNQQASKQAGAGDAVRCNEIGTC